MTDDFTDLLKRESLPNLTRILQVQERKLSEVKNRLYNTVHAKYRVLREASEALLKIHAHLTSTKVDCEAVMRKMTQLSASKLTVSCPEFDELAASLQDSLIRSLHTIWTEPVFDPQRYRYMTDSPKQLLLAKKPDFDAYSWVKASEDLAQSFVKTDRPNIPAAILGALQSVRIDEHALSNSSMNNFSYIVKRLDDHTDLIRNILHGYTSYAESKYLQPIARACMEEKIANVMTPCAALILFSLISLRITLDLHKIHSALPPKVHDNFTGHINAYADTVLARQLLDSVCCRSDPTPAALKWFLKLTENLKNDFPMIVGVYSRTCAHTICNIIYKIFKSIAHDVLRRLLDISNEPEHQSQISDVTDKINRLQRLLLEACSSNNDHCMLVGDALNALLKLIWIGFLAYIDPSLDYEALIAEELTYKASMSTPTITTPGQIYDICAPLAQNMTEFMSNFRDFMPLPHIDLGNLSNQDRASLIDSARVLRTLEENAARDSIAFRLHNWDCKNLKDRFITFQNSQQAVLTDSLANQMAHYFCEAFSQGGFPRPEEVQSCVIEPIVGLISQINYYCSRTEDRSPKSAMVVTSGAKLMSELLRATEDERITSLKVEASVRAEDNLKSIATKQCTKMWRERIILEAFLRAIRKVHHEKKLGQNLNMHSKVLFVCTVLSLCDYVVPAGRAINSLTTDYLSGMLAMICAPNAALPELTNLLSECSRSFNHQN